MRNCYGLGLSASGGCAVRDWSFLYGTASLEWKGRAVPYRKPVRCLRALVRSADLTSRNMASTRLDRRRAAETCAGQVLRAPPEIQARMEGGQSAVFGRLLHVKHSVLREGNADIRTVAAKSKTVRAEPESSFLTVICFTWNNGETVLGKPLFQMRA